METKPMTLPSAVRKALRSKPGVNSSHTPFEHRVGVLAAGLMTWLAHRALARGDFHELNHILLTWAVNDSDHHAPDCALSRTRIGATAVDQMHLAVCGDQVPPLARQAAEGAF